MRTVVTIPAIASASVLHSAAVGGSVVGVVGTQLSRTVAHLVYGRHTRSSK